MNASKVFVDLVFEALSTCRAGAKHFVDLKLGAFDQFGGKQCGGTDGNNLIVIAVEDQCGHVDLLQIFGKICFRKEALMQSKVPFKPACIPLPAKMHIAQTLETLELGRFEAP